METYNQIFRATKKSIFFKQRKKDWNNIKVRDTKLHLFLHLIIQFISRLPESQGSRRNAIFKAEEEFPGNFVYPVELRVSIVIMERKMLYTM